jgi:hypothetical protein
MADAPENPSGGGAAEAGRTVRAWRRFRAWPTWVQASLWFGLLLIAGAAVSTPPAMETAVEKATTTSTAEATTTTRKRTTTTRKRTTTTRRPTTTTTTVPTTTTTTVPPVPIEVAHFHGANDTQTDDFEVRGKWTLTAEIAGGAGTGVEIYSASGARLDYVSFDPGTYTSQFRQGCVCYFDISTFGSTYTLTVTDVPD